MNTSVPLGSKVRETITGFEGIVTARTEWLWGCARVAVQPPALHEGKPVEAQWFDESQVVVIAHDAAQRQPVATTGGPDRPHGGRPVGR